MKFFVDEDYQNTNTWEQEESGVNNRHVPEEYVSLGGPTEICTKCNAVMWKEERVNKNVTRGVPIFSMCCGKGQIQLPKTLPTPPYLLNLYNDKQKGPVFMSLIRVYNSMFSFTSTGGHVDYSINRGGSPYIYRLNGQNHHVFGQFLPEDGEAPRFCQLYIYDTTNEVSNRMRWRNVSDDDKVEREVVEGLMNMLDETNELVQEFRQTRDRFEAGDVVDLKITLKVSRSESGRENHITPSDEVAGIMVGDTQSTKGHRDIIIESKQDGLTRISDIHPKLMALQYPILFPHGEDGYHDDIDFVHAKKNTSRKRQKVSMKEYYSYKLQVRPDEGLYIF